MEESAIIKLLWAVNFFFFTLVLIFIWSKILVVSQKIKVSSSLLEKIRALSENVSDKPVEPPAAKEEDEQPPRRKNG